MACSVFCHPCSRLSLVPCEAISLLLVPRSLFRKICTPTYEKNCPPFDGKIAHVVLAFCLVNRSCAGLLRRAYVDVPVPQILHQIVDVPVPQIMEETVPVPQIQEQIVEVVKALFERCAVVQQLLTGGFFFFEGGTQSASEWNLCVLDAMDADLDSWFWIVHHSTFCCLLELFTLFVLTMICAETAADATLVGTQPCSVCWTRARSSSSELVDTATAVVRGLPRISPRVHAIRPFASCELDSCSVSAVPLAALLPPRAARSRH